MTRFSVLDLVPVRSDQSSSDALAATAELARAADRLGFHRFWVAEHHNMPAVAATAPPVLIAHLAAITEGMRIGSGGVMLPNHAPLVVAEQFAMLEALHPGRIDLGIGRAPGSDPVTSWALRSAAGRDDSDVQRFPQYLDDLVAMMGPDGVPVPIQGRRYVLKATPVAVAAPAMWLLGSSTYSAQLAAAKGLPYVFAHHFSGQGTQEALSIYRSQFRPSDVCDRPTTFLTVNAVVADSHAEAVALALPNLQTMVRLRTGQPLVPLDLAEDAGRVAQDGELGPAAEGIIAAGLDRMILGTADDAATQVEALAARFGVDEVMVNPVASARRGTDAATAPARVRTLELLAKA